MNFPRQLGWFLLEALISLFLVAIITSATFCWINHSYQQSRHQIAQIKRLQSGNSLLELMIGLLLTSLCVLAICHIYLIVEQFRSHITDDLRQQRTAVLFYLALEPYLENASYAGCDPSTITLPTKIATYSPTDPTVPLAIRNKTQSDVLFLYGISQRFDGTIFIDSCNQTHHLEKCWIYLAESQFHYRNGKAMHTVFAACEQYPVNPLIRGVASMQITLKNHALLFEWQSESTLDSTQFHWQTNFKI